MSITDRNFSGRTYDIKIFYPLTMLSLNDIFKESMRKILAEHSTLKIITRCENLPRIRGNSQDVVVLFEELIRMIITDKNVPAELYLYIDCAEVNQMQSIHVSEGFKTYTVKFRTNISQTKNWEEENDAALKKCRKIVSDHNAIFLVNSSNQNGCLFSITLPGKI
jgi:hypothetical protein